MQNVVSTCNHMTIVFIIWPLLNSDITLFKSMTSFCGTDNISQSVFHIQTDGPEECYEVPLEDLY